MAVRDHSLHLRGLVRVGAGGSSGGLPEKEGTMGFFVYCRAAMSARELFVGCARGVAREGYDREKHDRHSLGLCTIRRVTAPLNSVLALWGRQLGEHCHKYIGQ